MYPVLASLFGRLLALPPLYLGLWALLAVLTVGLIALMQTPWGRERPTHRYVLLSIVAHLALICLATTVRFMSAPEGEEAASPLRVRIVMSSPAPKPIEPEPIDPEAIKPEAIEPSPIQAAVPPVAEAAAEPETIHSDPPRQTITPDQAPAAPSEPLAAPPLLVEPAPIEPAPAETIAENLTEQPEPTTEPKQAMRSEPAAEVESTAASPIEPPSDEPSFEPLADPPTFAAATESAPVEAYAPIQPVSSPLPPSPYSARNREERLKVVEQEGGSRATEDAVAGALAWLATAQSSDGRWDADRWSAGRETRALGHDRRGAGARADTGITGLALLAFLGAGNTHERGEHADSVGRGLDFLLRAQTSDGGLMGDAAVYAQTYCHSMATFALAEAYAISEDPRLAGSTRRAVDFLVARQDRSGGGWRYKPGDEGDMSQMGWIIMALRSAELAGIEVPPTVWSSIERFVRSTQRGAAGGLSSYQPRSGVSRTMTAEALYCRQILGWPTTRTPMADEAVGYLLARLPGQGRANLYYWYYAALALHHHRTAGGQADHAWRTWNRAMSATLVGTQAREGSSAGSWSPDTLWGGYGGRVYSTAMATMCLEVYYRYDAAEVARDPWIAARPTPLRR